MKNLFRLSSILFVALLPAVLLAQTKEHQAEVAQGWVNQHNDKLKDNIKAYVKHINGKKKGFHLASLHKKLVPMKHVGLSVGPKNGVELAKKSVDGEEVPMVALYESKAQDNTFLIADYADELDDRHSSSDIYIKLGLRFFPLFHADGYRGCARILTLGKGSPIFFEVNHFGGGSRVDRTYYILDPKTVKNMASDMAEHPEQVKPEDYIQEVLKLSVWLDGFTLYKDLDKDGRLGIVNCSKDYTPDDLRSKLKEKYGMTDNDFDGAFRKKLTFYSWNDKKTQFEDMGEYYY